MIYAVSKLSVKLEHLLIDAMVMDFTIAQTKIIHGDARSASTEADSIVAKVTREVMIKEFAL